MPYKKRHGSYTGAHPVARSMPPFTNYYGKIIIQAKIRRINGKKSAFSLHALRLSSKPSKPHKHCRSSDSLPTGGAFPSSSLEDSGHRMPQPFLESSQQRDCPGFSPDSLLILFARETGKRNNARRQRYDFCSDTAMCSYKIIAIFATSQLVDQ